MDTIGSTNKNNKQKPQKVKFLNSWEEFSVLIFSVWYKRIGTI